MKNQKSEKELKNYRKAGRIGASILLLVLVACWQRNAEAERVNVSTVTTAMLMDHCNAPRHVTNSDFCGGYVMGVFDALAGTRVVCVPDTATTQQIMSVVVKYLKEHPERWHELPSKLIEASLVSNFSCSK